MIALWQGGKASPYNIGSRLTPKTRFVGLFLGSRHSGLATVEQPLQGGVTPGCMYLLGSGAEYSLGGKKYSCEI